MANRYNETLERLSSGLSIVRSKGVSTGIAQTTAVVDRVEAIVKNISDIADDSEDIEAVISRLIELEAVPPETAVEFLSAMNVQVEDALSRIQGIKDGNDAKLAQLLGSQG